MFVGCYYHIFRDLHHLATGFILHVLILAALPVNKEEDPCLSTLILLSELLRHHIVSAEQNLVQASVSAPIYGTLQSIRTVMKGLHLTPTPPVCDVVCDLVKTCEKIALIVSPVVCSSSPEGFLPATNTEKGTSDLESQLSSSNITSGNAQSLLLCCWHSMKEIALLLGYLVGNLPVISKGKQDGIISSEQVCSLYVYSNNGVCYQEHIHTCICSLLLTVKICLCDSKCVFW